MMDFAASLFVAIVAATASFWTGMRTITIAPPLAAPDAGAAAQTAMILRTEHLAAAARFTNAAAFIENNTSTVVATTTWITPGLLPKVTLGKSAKSGAASSTQSQTNGKAGTPKFAPTSKPAAPPPPATAPLATATEILTHATTTLVRRIGGAYGLIFNAVSGGKTVLSWQYGTATIGGANGTPQFSATYSCNPPPGAPPAPLFAVRTNYICTVSLTALAGADRRTISQDFPFTTGAGELSASPPANMNTHLSNVGNGGGFVFTNTDSEPISILSETFNIAYTGLITAYGPLILRLVDPTDATHYLDYHMEDFPAVASSPGTPSPAASSSYAHAETGITLSWPLAVPSSDAKLLPLEVLGVHKLSVAGVNPEVTITLAGVTTDRNDIDIQIGSPQISWSCIVATGYYDPNATSGPFATGEACQN